MEEFAYSKLENSYRIIKIKLRSINQFSPFTSKTMFLMFEANQFPLNGDGVITKKKFNFYKRHDIL